MRCPGALFFTLCIFLSVIWPLDLHGQPASTEQQRTAEQLVQLYENWRQTTDAEQKIQLGEQILGLETVVESWPLQTERERVKSEVWFGLGQAYVSRLHGDHSDNLEKAIAVLEAALAVGTREALPIDWAATQTNLGNAYAKRTRGDQAENLEKAIAAYDMALTVLTRDAQPTEWGRLQSNLGNVYTDRIRGDRGQNLEKAITAIEAALGVRTREAHPIEWGTTQLNLAIAFGERIQGDRADNIEKSIAASEAALTVFSRATQPKYWAFAQFVFASAALGRIRGERADNLENAIAGFEATLTVYVREAAPLEWARTQSNLVFAYLERIRGDRAGNIEKAIAAGEAALTVRTREAAPFEWARTQISLGAAYEMRVRGDSRDNLDKAIGFYESALTVAIREVLPFEWASTQHNLGHAYSNRFRGDRADNLEKAINRLEAALTVRTREAYPVDWASTQESLGYVYSIRVRGQQDSNLERAVAAYEASLTVRTSGAMPRDHLRTLRQLGGVFLQQGDRQKAKAAYAGARDTFLLLIGQGLNDAEARDLIGQAGPLFSEAAFVAIQSGENESALALASEGRARQMAIALTMQALDLPGQKRLRLDGLRSAIRVADREIEATQGLEHATAIKKLAGLRRELVEIVKEAGIKLKPDAALAQAKALAGKTGAVVLPIATMAGGKILIVTNGSKAITVIDLPELNTERLALQFAGDANGDKLGGWFAAYTINYLGGYELNERWNEWLSAIGNLGPDLWRLLGGALDLALQDAGVKTGARVVWLPTGTLGVLPLGLAQDPATKRRLADTYEIVYAPSLAALSAVQKQITKAAPATLAAIVNPTGDLAGTEEEGKLVASYFTAKDRLVLERAAATPDKVLAALKGKTHWHFASHGTVSWEDPRQSALLMHKHEKLSVARLLAADGLGRPRLVVLSACETGLHSPVFNPDEFVGLPGTFMALGASGVVGTLWPVSDAATALLMARFYELHMGAKRLPPPTALRKAQEWLRQATNVDLAAYARASTKKGRLDGRHLATIERALSEEGLSRSRSAVAVEWLSHEEARAAGKKMPPTQKASSGAKRVARPYSHPYFWAGFIYTGL